MSITIKLTPKQKQQLFNFHLGVGFLAYKSSKDTITYTEFFIHPKTRVPHYIESGMPVEFHFEEE